MLEERRKDEKANRIHGLKAIGKEFESKNTQIARRSKGRIGSAWVGQCVDFSVIVFVRVDSSGARKLEMFPAWHWTQDFAPEKVFLIVAGAM